jgi:GH24 family phage-related lysozyme (muramidase)
MKRLLLLLVLSPVILFAQARRQELTDSVKAAMTTKLQSVSALLGNSPHSTVEHMDVFDSSEYVTIVVRIHVARDYNITPIPAFSAVRIKTGELIAGKVDIVELPGLPPPVAETDTRLPLSAVFGLTINIPVVRVDTVTVPPLPPPVPEADTRLPLMRVLKLNADIPVVSVDAVALPSLPAPVADADTRLPLIAVVKLNEEIPVVKADMAALPTLPPPVADADTRLPLMAVLTLSMDSFVVILHIVLLSSLPDIVLETIENLPLLAAVILPVEKISIGKIDTIAITSFEVKKMLAAGMHLSTEGYSLLEKLEGFSPELYFLNDGGSTIGFGFFIPNGEGTKWDKGVTWEEAEQMMRQKVPAYEDQVKRYINVPLTQNEFDALTMLAYNLGGFSKATSIVNDVNSQAGFDKLQRDWNRFVHSKAPAVARGLMNRRKDEMGVTKNANYQPERKIQILKTRK